MKDYVKIMIGAGIGSVKTRLLFYIFAKIPVSPMRTGVRRKETYYGNTYLRVLTDWLPADNTGSGD